MFQMTCYDLTKLHGVLSYIRVTSYLFLLLIKLTFNKNRLFSWFHVIQT